MSIDPTAAETTRHARLADLRAELVALRQDAVRAEVHAAGAIEAVHPAHRESARNVVHYRALRSHDLRALQPRLSAEGLSSLGRMESGVLTNLDAVIGILDAALGVASAIDTDGPSGWGEGRQMLRENATALLGPEPEGRNTRVMVTMPTTAATDAEFVKRCAEAGMDLARINCAHDDPRTWRAIAAQVHNARPDALITMDLAGPKLRTGPIAEGPHVLKCRTGKNAYGQVIVPAQVWLGAAPVHSAVTTAAPVVDPGWGAELVLGDHVRIRDARDRKRTLTVTEVASCGVLVTCDRTVYLSEGLTVTGPHGRRTEIGALSPTAQSLRIHRGDTIELTASLAPTTPTDDGRHRVGCTLPEVFGALREGHRVFFDDGKIEGVVTGTSAKAATIGVTRSGPTGTNLRAEKGINVPDTALPIPALTDDDIAALDTVVEIADNVALSFVRSPADVAHLQRELDERGATELGLVAKIETLEAFAALPEILLQMLRTRRVGVMIARGDLAVEAGFEQLAEVQEEILWLCEAAQVPVIWATEVLDSLADRGLPTRAEITDAAAGERAECVMLNKGPHIVDAIEALTDILARMKGHLDKKRPLLRRLRSWDAPA